MNSIEKIYSLMERVGEASDEEIADNFPAPVPPFVLRGFLATIASLVPDDPDELDTIIGEAADMLNSLRSDVPDTIDATVGTAALPAGEEVASVE